MATFTPATPAPAPMNLADRAARVRFRRAVTLMAFTLVAPGSAQLITGNRRVGRVALRIWFTTIVLGVTALVVAYEFPGFAVRQVVVLHLLTIARLGLIAGAIGWVYLLVDAWRIGQPLSLVRQQRLMMTGVNGVMCFSVAAVLLYGSHMAGTTNDFLSMFGTGAATGAHDGRYNVLLLGGDSGASRVGMRTDSMTVASIDADTGKTVLIGLPRNLENFTFAPGSVMAKQFPHGFDCGIPNCELNAVSTWAEDHPKLFGKTDVGDKTAGMEATLSAIEGVTGLKINYWAMVDLQGFRDLSKAIGGVTIDVRQPIAVGKTGDIKGYIPAGKQKLEGNDLLWYARSRATSDDYSRMARQKCVMNAMLSQISPMDVVRHFDALEKATTGTISTDLPGSEVGRFVDLALKARSQKMATVSLVPPVVNTADPSMPKVHALIANAIAKSEGRSVPGGGAKKKHHHHAVSTAGQMGEGSLGSYQSGYTANQTSNLGASC
ncbi:MAG: LCP family protein [Nocardioidaceae bacterium]|nr:LCP family protein [Nocardioidaceae bacterium]MCL2614397.1 LCP family protein [Nocardioidaceae bacterium]